MDSRAFGATDVQIRDMSRPRAWSRRTAAAVGVAVLHSVLVWVFILNASVRGGPPPNDVLQVVLISPDETRPPAPPPEPSSPEVPPVSAVAPRAPAENAPAPLASFMAATNPGQGEAPATPGTPMPVVDAIDFDTDTLRNRCARAYPESAPDLDVNGMLTLLIRVEPSGRPSETKIVASSGSSQLDAAVAACFLSLGAFEPVTVNGRAVRSWQRVIWRPEGRIDTRIRPRFRTSRRLPDTIRRMTGLQRIHLNLGQRDLGG